MSLSSRTLLLAATTIALAVPLLTPAPPVYAEPGPVTALARNTRGEALAVAPDGTAVAVWATTAPPYEVVARRHEPGGSWDAPVVLGRGYAPAAAVDGSGAVTVAWLTQRRNRTDGVSATRMQPTGDWAVATHLTDDAAAPGHRPGAEVYGATDLDLAVNDAGTAVAAWAWGSETGHHPWRVQAAFRSGDDPWSPVDAVTSANGSRTPEVGIDDRGTGVVVWGRQALGRPRVLRARLHDDAAGWTTPATVASAGDAPELVVTPAGEAVLLFADRRLAAAAAVMSAEGVWSPPERLSDPQTDLSDAALAVDGTGTAVVALGRSGGRVDVVSRPSGGAWGDPERVVRPRVPVFDVLLAAGPTGDLFLAWGGYGLYGRFRTAGGSWLPSATISPDAGVEVLESASAAMADDGSVAVLWKQEARPLKVRLLAQPGGR